MKSTGSITSYGSVFAHIFNILDALRFVAHFIYLRCHKNETLTFIALRNRCGD